VSVVTIDRVRFTLQTTQNRVRITSLCATGLRTSIIALVLSLAFPTKAHSRKVEIRPVNADSVACVRSLMRKYCDLVFQKIVLSFRLRDGLAPPRFRRQVWSSLT
jgi:hypothetical protein